MGVSAHLRGIVIAGGLAALALALGFVTLLMNQTASQAGTHTVLSLKARHHTTTATKTTKNGTTVHVVKLVDPNLAAALDAGLPRSVAKALAAKPVVVVELTSQQDSVAKLALEEAKAGALDGGASFVAVNVDVDGGDVQVLTRLLGDLPTAPAALIYTRPATLYVTLPGFNDRVTVQQAVQNAAPVKVVVATIHQPAKKVAPVKKVVASEWATHASALCRAQGTQTLTVDPGAGHTRKAQMKALNKRFVAQITALKPPAGKAAQVAQLNMLLAKSFAAQRAMILASFAHNSKAFDTSAAEALGYEPRINKLEQQLGAIACVKAPA